VLGLDVSLLVSLSRVCSTRTNAPTPPTLHNTCQISYPIHLLPPHCIQYTQVEYSCLLSFSYINMKMANGKCQNM